MFYSRSNKTHKPTKRINRSVPLDPACGSGNFLTETYLCLRRLEDEIFRILNKGQARLDFGVVYFGNRVRLSQFYGIEINDFAVRVARVALFIAQLQSNVESVMSLGVHGRDLLPLEDCATIVHGNALRMPWNEVLPANKCSYIIGNPPFIGANNPRLRAAQKRSNKH